MNIRSGSYIAAAGLFALAGAEIPWYEMRNQPGADLYEIEKAVVEDLAQQDEAAMQDLTRYLQNNPEYYESAKNHRFYRWKDLVESKIYPSGDLSLLRVGQEEMLKLLPLDGKSLPPMRGEWEPLGPYAANTSGAGRLNWIAFHPTDNNSYMVGSPSGGLWMTRDAGATWFTTTDRIATLGVAWAEYHPTNPSIIYMATGDHHSEAKSIGMLKSTDGGQTWNTTGLTFPISGSVQIQKLLVDPRDGNKILVAATNGMHVSTDGGNTFRVASGASGKFWDVELHPSNSSVVYASGRNLFKSTDGGATFSQVSGVPIAGDRMQIAVTAAQPDWLYVLRGSRTARESVHRSTNQGGSFTQMAGSSTSGFPFVWYAFAFGASSTDANLLFAGCQNIFKSTDGGANWTSTGSGIHVDHHGAIWRKDGVLFNTSDGGVWRSTNATSWTNLNNNLNIGQSYRTGVFRDDYDMVCTGRQDNSTDIRVSAAGGFRRSPVGGDGFECFWNNTGTRWYGESQNGAFRRCSFSNGTASSCVSITTGLPAGIWNTPWSQDPNNNNTIFAGRGGQIWRSTNEGDSWSQLGTMAGSGTIRDFKVAPSNSQVIYVIKGTGLFRTSNGSTWTDVKGTISGSPANLAVSPSDPNEAWVTILGYTATSKIWRTTNGGQSWTNETGTGLPNLPCQAVALDDLGQKGVYAGTDNGVYFKRPGTAAWQNFSDGLPNASVRELDIARKGTNNNDRRLIAATYGRGVWRTKLWDDTNPTGIRKADALPPLRDFKASFAGSTLHLSFLLGADRLREGQSLVQLATVDGKTVWQEDVPNFGLYTRAIDLSRHGKGLYVFVLRNGEQKTSRQIAFQ